MCIREHGLVDVCSLMKEVDGLVLMATISMLLNLHPPTVDALHNINSHLPQSAHVIEDAIQQLD